MLRMKSRKRTKKMRGGGIFGPEFGGHVSKANEQAAQGWNTFLYGVDRGKRIGKQGMHEAQTEYNKRIKQPTGVTGGTPPVPTTTTTLLQPLPPIHKPRRQVIYAKDKDLFTLVRDADKPIGSTIIGGKRKTKKRRRKRKKKKTKRKKRRRKRKTKKRKRRR